MSVRCEQSGGHGAGAGVMGFAHAPGGEQSALSQGPPLGLSPTPRPSPLSTRWRGRGGAGWTGIRYSRPSVREERRAWNRRKKVARGGRTLAWGSETQALKRKVGQTLLATIQLVERYFAIVDPGWVSL